MKIAEIKTFLVGRFLLVRVYTDEGLVGNGEAGLWGHHGVVREAIEEMGEYYVGKDPLTIEHHYQVVSRSAHFMGGVLSAAMSAIDVALWDIMGKSLGVPGYQLLGGKCRDKGKLFENIGGNTPTEVRESARAKVEQGFISLRMTPFARDFEQETGTRNIATAVELVLRRGRGTGPLVLSLALIVAGVVGGQFSFTHAEGERQQVALVQGNVPQDLKWLATMRKETREIYAGLTEGLPEGTLVVWPESAMIEFYQDIDDFVDDQGEAVAAKGGALISGLPWRDESRTPTTYHNSIAVVGTDSEDGVYHKQKLVPFGEYVPLQGLIRGLIPFFDLPMSSFTPGSPRQPNLYALSHEIAPFICYEILYPELVASRTGSADVLLTISNDAWFGTSAGPHQHFQMTRLRALETGRWLLRGTNNGITAVVDHHGKVVERLPQFERDVLVSEYQPRQGETPFMLAGVWPTLLLALAFVVLGRGRRARGLLESF